MLQVKYVASCIWRQQSTVFMHAQPCSWLSAQNFEKEGELLRKQIQTEQPSQCYLSRSSLSLTVNISFTVALAVVSSLDFFLPRICSDFPGMLRRELEIDGNEECYNYKAS